MRSVIITMPIVLALVCASGVHAQTRTVTVAEFDEYGARPRTYRISCANDSVGLSNPSIMRSNRSGRKIASWDQLRDTFLGSQDGRLVLNYDCAERGVIIIGDASNLDDIRLLPGARLELKENRFRGIQGLMRGANRTQRFSFDDDFQLESFSGELILHPEAMRWLVDAIIDGNRINEKVFVNTLGSRWSGFVWEAQVDRLRHLPADSLERIRVTYSMPLTEALASLDGEKRDRLVAHHRDIVAAGRAYLESNCDGTGCAVSLRELPPVLEYLDALEF